MPAILEHASLVIGNEADANDVLGIAPPDSDVEQGRISREGYVEVARAVAKRFSKVRHVAFTLRESVSASHNRWGTMLYSVDNDTALFAPERDGAYSPYEITDIVDRVGAGDAFAAGAHPDVSRGRRTGPNARVRDRLFLPRAQRRGRRQLLDASRRGEAPHERRLGTRAAIACSSSPFR